VREWKPRHRLLGLVALAYILPIGLPGAERLPFVAPSCAGGMVRISRRMALGVISMAFAPPPPTSGKNTPRPSRGALEEIRGASCRKGCHQSMAPLQLQTVGKGLGLDLGLAAQTGAIDLRSVDLARDIRVRLGVTVGLPLVELEGLALLVDPIER